MQIKTKGIVLKQRSIGENDKIITVLTQELGVIEASARGVKSTRSAISGAVQVLSYSEFCLYKGKAQYIVNSAELIEPFYQLRTDVIKLSLGGYFCELVYQLGKLDDENASVFLKLILNSLFFLQSDKLTMNQLKSIFELRALSIAGFMPNLVCCADCAAYEAEVMVFLPTEGIILCDSCINHRTDIESEIRISLSPDVLSAMRYIVFSEEKKLFSFKLSGVSLKQLNYITENYTYLHSEAKFNSLEMYHQLLMD